MIRTFTFRRYMFAAAVMLAAFSFASSQQLVSSSVNGTMSPAELGERNRTLFGNYAVPVLPATVELVKVTYTSVDVNNKKVNLTGLVAWPFGGAPRGMVVYCHGTTVNREFSPSKFDGKGKAPETVEAIVGYATGGYAVVIPDYLGMGDHKAAHPYPLSKVNAASGRDMISAARALARQKNYQIGKDLFISGYSEGGGVAMALTQLLQSYMNPEYQVTRSAPASGPYDLSGTTREFMMKETEEQTGFVLRLYLLSNSTHYLNKQYGYKLNTFYKTALANAIGLNFRLNPTDEGVIKNIGITTTLMRSKNRLSNVLQPAFLADMKANRKTNPFVRMLHENDTYAWTTRVPMLLLYVDKDFVVSPTNSQIAYDWMRNRGVNNSLLRMIALPDTLNHITGIAPAVAKSRAFFDGGFAAVPEAK